MDTSTSGERTLTELDHTRLTGLTKKLRGRPASGDAHDIDDALDLARLVPSREVPADIVTMYSQVLIEDTANAGQRCVTLCYPADARPAEGFISVLSPVGASLLGLRVGATAHWLTPGGEPGSATVAALLFQPEASGDYTR